jgi:hypothetical protein
MNIVRLFYPEMANKHWGDFRELVDAKYSGADEFSKLLVQAATFLKLIRDTRDCLEHNLEGVKIWDFAPQADGTIAPPTIEVDFRKSVLQRCSISAFMQEVTKAMQVYFEMIVVHMCSKSAQPFAGLCLTVGEVSPEFQNAWRVRFGYGSYYPGWSVHPLRLIPTTLENPFLRDDRCPAYVPLDNLFYQ